MTLFRAERPDIEHRPTAWVVVRIDLPRARLDVRAPAGDRLEALAAEPGLLAAVNGGFFERDRTPSGLLAAHGERIGAYRPRGGSGVLAVTADRAAVVVASDTADLAGADIAMQCGPRLVEPGGVVGVRADDGKRAARTTACVREGGRELDLVLAWTKGTEMDGPGLLEMARWLAAPLTPGDAGGCDAALNLDGGPSTGIVVRGGAEALRKPFGPVPFALIVRSREP